MLFILKMTNIGKEIYKKCQNKNDAVICIHLYKKKTLTLNKLLGFLTRFIVYNIDLYE